MNKFFKKYSFIGALQMLYFVLRTKLLFLNARIIRFPFDLRGKNYIQISPGLSTGKGCRIEAYPFDGKSKVLRFGKNVRMNDYVHITAMKSVVIGNNVLMASRIYISDCTHGSYSGDEYDSDPEIPPVQREYSIQQVVIGDNVWLGESVSILPGVSIGKGSIIGANSVVTKNIPEFVIAVGIPARPVKKFNFETKRWETIK